LESADAASTIVSREGVGLDQSLGHVTESGDTWLLGLCPSASLTLKAKTGKVFVSIGAPLGSDTLEYTITGGTKAAKAELAATQLNSSVRRYGGADAR
jgi:hypothetical protein